MWNIHVLEQISCSISIKLWVDSMRESLENWCKFDVNFRLRIRVTKKAKSVKIVGYRVTVWGEIDAKLEWENEREIWKVESKGYIECKLSR